jgi:DNA-binding transcriptional ArsR family regulator
MARSPDDAIRRLTDRFDELRDAGWTLAGDDVMPATELVLEDPATIGVLAQPVRARVVTLLHRQPRTAKQLAEAMGVPVTRLYYHLNMLVDGGLVRVIATRRSGAQTESAYAVTALSFRLDPSLMQADDVEGVVDGVTSILDYAKAGLASAIRSRRVTLGDSEDHRTLLALAPVRLTEDGQRAFVSAMEAFLDEHCVPDDEGEEILVLAAVFPDTTAAQDAP